MQLFHQSERLFVAGDAIAPGRWGSTVLAAGRAHPFFFREQLLELWRVTNTTAPVSRLTCSYAFDDLSVATAWADDGSHCYIVEPIDADASKARLDMLWLTWMGEPQSTFEKTVARCRAYWSGESTADAAQHARPTWEWLFDCALHVVAPVD